ncbi:hypothetical protein DP939_01390 [Spongiactinospora rosea]|uniref:Uncharacterized protein n=1 Tax=Spongiactinospora rosea TaxID=2248750 RepID=A0A366M5S3_9ACTN|nr:hypothetical protein [Spongiactinospora rosea]RBQ21397.1 hypothetical protein DP939_01390 [Spongiactinospora rosea]
MTTGYWSENGPIAREHYSKGQELGREEGRREGRVSILLEILANRGIPLSDADIKYITFYGNSTKIDTWADRCLTVASAEELFAKN